MDDERASELLHVHDDPHRVERPPTFNEDQERRRAESLARDLESAFGMLDYEIGPPAIQDATFLAAFRIPPDRTASGHGLWLRVGNFGRLATAGAILPDAYHDGELDDLVDPKEWETLLHLVEKHGYVFVDQNLLLRDYDGSNGRTTYRLPQ